MLPTEPNTRFRSIAPLLHDANTIPLEETMEHVQSFSVLVSHEDCVCEAVTERSKIILPVWHVMWEEAEGCDGSRNSWLDRYLVAARRLLSEVGSRTNAKDSVMVSFRLIPVIVVDRQPIGRRGLWQLDNETLHDFCSRTLEIRPISRLLSSAKYVTCTPIP